MNLADHLSLRTPIVWVNTDEPGRVTDSVIEAEKDRKVYRFDTVRGLLLWSVDNTRWLRCLAPDPMDGLLKPIMDLGQGIMKALGDHAVMVLDNAHTIADSLLGVFTSVGYSFRSAFKQDDLSEIPAQFICLSYKDELPKELARIAVLVPHELPDKEELRRLTNVIVKAQTLELADQDMDKIVRAGMGMSELEFIESALMSVRQANTIDPEVVGKTKLERLKQSKLLTVVKPELTINDLGGLDLAKDLIESIGWSWNNPAVATQYRVKPQRRVLLIGVPGSGKSLLCEATAGVLGVDLGKGGISKAMDSLVGESEANMRRMFQLVKAMAPIVFWIDEFGRDSSGGQSSGKVDAGTTDRVHGEFLTGLQELPHDVFLMCAANNIDQLPPEMTRADRFDVIMFVGMPTVTERQEIFKIHLGKNHEEYELDKLAEATPFFTGAEIKSLIESQRGPIARKHERQINTQDLLVAAPLFKNRVWIKHRADVITMYNRAMTDWEWASSGQMAEAEKIMAAAMTPIGPVPQYAPSSQSPAKKRSSW